MPERPYLLSPVDSFHRLKVTSAFLFPCTNLHGHVQALFISLYKNFLNVLMERLPEASKVATLQGLKSIHADPMSFDPEESSAMEVDDENGKSKRFLFCPQ